MKFSSKIEMLFLHSRMPFLFFKMSAKQGCVTNENEKQKVNRTGALHPQYYLNMQIIMLVATVTVVAIFFLNQ